jgi:protein TonB
MKTIMQPNETNQSWTEMVFAHRNKDYGAYAIRQQYSNNMAKGMSISFLIIMLFFTLPNLIAKEKIAELIITEFCPMDDNFTIVPDKIKVIKPISTAAKPPKTDAFTNINIVNNDTKNTSKLAIKDSLNNAIGIVNNDNADDNENVIIFANAERKDTTNTNKQITKVVIEPKESEKPHIIVEQMPEFTGGYLALAKYLQANIKYPKYAVDNNIEGKVGMRFVINKDGSVSDIEVARSLGFGCDEEAIRVVQNMPKWTPGRQQGKAVKVQFQMMVNFAFTN